jgi:hypothetical protein
MTVNLTKGIGIRKTTWITWIRRSRTKRPIHSTSRMCQVISVLKVCGHTKQVVVRPSNLILTPLATVTATVTAPQPGITREDLISAKWWSEQDPQLFYKVTLANETGSTIRRIKGEISNLNASLILIEQNG